MDWTNLTNKMIEIAFWSFGLGLLLGAAIVLLVEMYIDRKNHE